jgi:hypothetical protein
MEQRPSKRIHSDDLSNAVLIHILQFCDFATALCVFRTRRQWSHPTLVQLLCERWLSCTKWDPFDAPKTAGWKPVVPAEHKERLRLLRVLEATRVFPDEQRTIKNMLTSGVTTRQEIIRLQDGSRVTRTITSAPITNPHLFRPSDPNKWTIGGKTSTFHEMSVLFFTLDQTVGSRAPLDGDACPF